MVPCCTLQELLRAHGLMQAYNNRLGPSGKAASNSSKRGKGFRISGLDWLCCSGCSSDKDLPAAGQQGEPHSQPSPKQVPPLRTVLSPVALLLLLAYAAATGFYLYTRASKLGDLGPQWW